MPLIVVYDANVLYPSTLRDVLIRVGIARLVQPRWTEQILDEVFRTLRANRPDLETTRLDRTRELMNAAVRDVVVSGYEHRIGEITLPDPDDRHVVAAAIHIEAKLIITKNLRDFPAAALEPWGISAQHPDAFLAEIHREHAHVLAEIVREIARAWSADESTPGHVVDSLAVDAPGVAGLIRASLRGGSGPS